MDISGRYQAWVFQYRIQIYDDIFDKYDYKPEKEYVISSSYQSDGGALHALLDYALKDDGPAHSRRFPDENIDKSSGYLFYDYYNKIAARFSDNIQARRFLSRCHYNGSTLKFVKYCDADGYDENGFDLDGYGRDGYNSMGVNRKGLMRNGFNREGMWSNGTPFDDEGFDVNGYDVNGYNRQGFDCDGFDRRGFSERGLHRNGTPFDDKGYDASGRDRQGYDRDGYDSDGKNRWGLTRAQVEQQRQQDDNDSN